MFPAGIRAAPFPAYAWLPPARLLLEPVNGSRTLYVDSGVGGGWGGQVVDAVDVVDVDAGGQVSGCGKWGGPCNWSSTEF